MDKNKREVIEMILDRLSILDEFERKILLMFNAEHCEDSFIDRVSDIGFKGIPLILGVEENDWLDDLIYDGITRRISKKQYFKSLEKYLKEME